MVNFKGLTAKAKQLAQRNPDKVNKVLDQAGNFVDKRTGRKYERHVDSVQQKARDYLGGHRAAGGSTPDDRSPGARPGGTDRLGGTDRPGEGPEGIRPDRDPRG
ncbi:antitoxin [Kocuria sediminis]|uniref:Antitoxin n=1 Tax=Kocuria sediminis TaxID=1038857 RepID=A0A6N8GMM1_9MICC|nr:antitoxin [Kocuria sediminis]MUN63520.1 antitoxin [Kocuria sediminis]